MIRRLISAGLAVVMLFSVACCPAFAAAVSSSTAPVESSSPSPSGGGSLLAPVVLFDGSSIDSFSSVSVVFGPFNALRFDNPLSSNLGTLYRSTNYPAVDGSSSFWFPFNALSAVDCFAVPMSSYGRVSFQTNFANYLNSRYFICSAKSVSGYFVQYLFPVNFSPSSFPDGFYLDFSNFFDFDSGINLLSSFVLYGSSTIGTKVPPPVSENSWISMGTELTSTPVSFSNIVVSLVSGFDGLGDVSSSDVVSHLSPSNEYVLDVVGSGRVYIAPDVLDFDPEFISIYVPASSVIDFNGDIYGGEFIPSPSQISDNLRTPQRFICPLVTSEPFHGTITLQPFESTDSGILRRLDEIKTLLQNLTGCQCKDILFNISQKLDDLGNMCNSFFKNANNFFSSVLARLDGITALLGDAGGDSSGGSLADESEALQNSTDQLQDAKPPASAPLGLFGVFGQIASFIGGGFSYVFDWFGWSDNSADFVYNSLGLVYSVEPDTSPVPIG